LAKGNAVVKTPSMTVYGIFVIFREKEDLIIVTGKPKLIRGKDVFHADRIILFSDVDKAKLEGNVVSHISRNH
jgi:lipopolysaccharide export system protein LptA